MHIFKFPFSMLPLLLLSIFIGRAQADQACQLLVFNQYCLGGDIVQLASQRPEFIHQQREGERFALIYPAGREKDYVMAYRGRIYKVLRKFEPSTSIRYREWRDLLTKRYGLPQEQSRFPAQATGLAAKINAIQRGEGRALLSWNPAASAWHVELGWTGEMGLHLAYILTRQAMEQSGSGGAD
ncbi:MAG: hypothetical protein KDI43_11250 [Gammaproteobacteria bacterium]|nr:hypothetical protein [Gammaproteobacteria bacterium]